MLMQSINKIWTYSFAEIVKKKQKQPLNPDTFVWKATGPSSDTQSMRGLRETGAAKHYQWFCENFMRSVRFQVQNGNYNGEGRNFLDM
jgi:hypothetical protein